MSYPKRIYKNALLLDGKIINWKMGTTHWDTVERAFNNRQPQLLFKVKSEQLRVESICAEVNSTEENNAFFNDVTFYEQFEIHENYPTDMFRPY